MIPETPVTLPVTLMDTDILSAIMRRHPSALLQAESYLSVHGLFSFSIITKYEILRGLQAKQASAQVRRFEYLCSINSILPLTDLVIERAAMIYGQLYRQGSIIGDADILIAATAIESGLALATNNTKHYQRIEGLRLINWLE